ncbi:hypothetical protein [Flagellimonas allohymeniacidonis]|uniref:Uncharacterized protein n=1 Tax=Flagellimonas allohymeniacidonis TaxID=2517819 RepID=A0A4Q8QFY5_9FLAO|nr:hypothetical protein [Allomuricauda hymeniacidonis]TAI49371.1 hypothetical protein EW142_06120 [Allomuricauda hymeniacidonis]
MAQDLRELFAKEREEKKYVMKKGHEKRFMSKLEEGLPKKEKRNNFFRWSIAASIAVVLGLGIYFYPFQLQPDETVVPKVVDNGNTDQNIKTISLGDLSPEFKRIEDYYVANINFELSGLEFNQKDKVLVDGYMERLAELDEEYRRLNTELNELGPNDNTISALIGNLQLRLQLLQKLKTKLNQLKSSKNEQKSASII